MDDQPGDKKQASEVEIQENNPVNPIEQKQSEQSGVTQTLDQTIRELTPGQAETEDVETGLQGPVSTESDVQELQSSTPQAPVRIEEAQNQPSQVTSTDQQQHQSTDAASGVSNPQVQSSFPQSTRPTMQNPTQSMVPPRVEGQTGRPGQPGTYQTGMFDEFMGSGEYQQPPYQPFERYGYGSRLPSLTEAYGTSSYYPDPRQLGQQMGNLPTQIQASQPLNVPQQQQPQTVGQEQSGKLSKRQRLFTSTSDDQAFFPEQQQMLSFVPQMGALSAYKMNVPSQGQGQPQNFMMAQYRMQQQPSPTVRTEPRSSASANTKKGSVISPEDRRPPTQEELIFYERHASVLQNLIVHNLQHLAFFPQSEWLSKFNETVKSPQVQPSSNPGQMPMQMQGSSPQQQGFNYMRLGDPRTRGLELKEEHSQSPQMPDRQQHYYEDFLFEPDTEMDPMMNLTFSNYPDNQQAGMRRQSTLRFLGHSGSAKPQPPVAMISLEEVLTPRLPGTIRSEVSKLTTFQKTLARYKCREVLGFYRLMLQHRNNSKLANAQMMENNSRFVVRTILNWGREFYENGGQFNKSRIGKHKRVTLFSDTDFRAALIEFAEQKGEGISVDSASAFIKEYHRQALEKDPSLELPSPPSSRATVHRWLKLLDIKLGPRGKKKTAKESQGET